jgi:hypothetical protein
MEYKIINKSNRNLDNVDGFVSKFLPHTKEKLGFDKPVTIVYKSDSENARKILGKTAYYDPQEFKIVLYVDDRHPKDILRSLSHELVHHAQNCRGEFDDAGNIGQEGYAQNDQHMRYMEAEAYLLGNGLIFRDFEDNLKKQGLEEAKKPKKPQISDKKWKENLVFDLLRQKYTQ